MLRIIIKVEKDANCPSIGTFNLVEKFRHVSVPRCEHRKGVISTLLVNLATSYCERLAN